MCASAIYQKKTRTEVNLSGSKRRLSRIPTKDLRITACAKPYTNAEPNNGKLRLIGNYQRRDNGRIT
jgi:hypothetical protein